MEEILGKSGRLKRRDLWLQAWSKQRAFLEFIQAEMTAKTKLHRTIPGVLDKCPSAHINDMMIMFKKWHIRM